MLRYCKGFLISLGMFTILPVPYFDWDEDSMALVMPCLPLVGVVLGGLWWLGAWLLQLLSPPPAVHGFLLALLPLLLAGMLHLDGYMDTMDAWLSHRDRDECLRILKDPHMGAFGTAAFGLLLLGYYSTSVALAGQAVWQPVYLCIAVVSRLLVTRLMATEQPISDTGYAATFCRARGARFHLGLLLLLCAVVGVAVWQGGLPAVLALLVQAVVLQGCWWLLRRRFGGISGDLCGCLITMGELAALLTLSLLL